MEGEQGGAAAAAQVRRLPCAACCGCMERTPTTTTPLPLPPPPYACRMSAQQPAPQPAAPLPLPPLLCTAGCCCRSGTPSCSPFACLRAPSLLAASLCSHLQASSHTLQPQESFATEDEFQAYLAELVSVVQKQYGCRSSMGAEAGGAPLPAAAGCASPEPPFGTHPDFVILTAWAF